MTSDSQDSSASPGSSGSPVGSPSPPAGSPPGSLRELVRVAWPLVLSSGSVSLLHVVDRIFLTWHSLDEVGAALPAGLLLWSLMSIGIGIGTYVNAFVSQYDGSGRKGRVSAAVWQGVYLAVVAGALMMALAPLAGEIVAWTGHSPNIQRLEAEYLRIGCLGGVPTILNAVMACFFSGRGRNLVVMGVNMSMVAINAVLDYLMIFGVGPFPETGIAGAAWATVIASICAAVAYFVVATYSPTAQAYHFWRHWRLDRELFGRLIRYGAPQGLQYLVDIAGFSLFILLIGASGERELKASNLAFNLNSLAFVPLLGVGTAVLTLVGRRIGEGRPDLAVRTTWLATGLSCCYTGLFAAVYLFAPGPLIAYFALNPNDPTFPEIASLIVTLLRFVALYSMFDALCIVVGAALRGAGDTRFCSVMSFACGWLLMVLPAWINYEYFGGNLMVNWWACTSYIATLGVIYVFRFRQGHWRSMRVIEDLHEPPTPLPPPQSDAAMAPESPTIAATEPHVG
jgi:MATE family multidrug resistance protein